MIFELKERIVILTSERWVDKHDLAKKIGVAYDGNDAMVVHYGSLKQKFIKKLGGDYTEEKLDAKVLEYVARAISTALISGSPLILDTDIEDIPGFETILKLIERILMLIGEMKDEYEEAKPKGNQPLRILHLAVEGTDEEKAAYFRRCETEYTDEIYPNMGSDAKILVELLRKEHETRINSNRNVYAGLLFKKYYTFSPCMEIAYGKIENKEDLEFKVDL